MRAESVEVVGADHALSTYPRCFAEFETDGTVIVKSQDTGAEHHRWAPGAWESVEGFLAGGPSIYKVTPANLEHVTQRREARRTA